jgi:flagellar basal-body rod modification protein FlgD
MTNVSANYTMPTILNTLAPAAGSGSATTAKAKANAASSAGTTSSTSSTTSGDDIGTTFLNLLAQELQNQDPTAPVDSTAMVGQMISLNQLDQLISINQSVTGTTTTGTTGAAQTAVQAADVATALSPSAAGAATSQLPFDPNTMMPVSSGNASTAATSVNSSPNVSTMGSSSLNNNTSGG